MQTENKVVLFGRTADICFGRTRLRE